MNGFVWGVFRAIFWKEWREHAKWALSAMAGLLIALLFSVTDRNGALDYRPKSFTEFWDGVGLVYFLGPRLMAIALGIIQVLPELRRDRWAFLLHRPCSGGLLFAGKSAAGLALLVAATATPLLGVALWAQLPGRMAGPFDWSLVWPAAFQIPAAVVLYFAALLTALRPSRWYGGRLLPLVGALVAGLLISASADLGGVTILWSLSLMAVVIAFAVCGSFANRDEPRRQNWLARSALATVLYVGAVVFCVAPYMIVQASWDSYIEAQPRNYTEYGVTKDGAIVRERYNRREYESIDVVEAGAKRREYLINDLARDSYLIVSSWLESQSSSGGASQTEISLAANAASARYGMTHWYYRSSSRNFIGYSDKTRLPIGVFGPQGFSSKIQDTQNAFAGGLRQNGQQIATFAGGSGQSGAPVPYLFGSQVYLIDWSDLTVAPLYSLNHDRIVNVNVLDRITDSRDGNYLVSAASQFVVLSPQGKVVFTTPREHLFPEYDSVRLNVIDGSRYIFWYFPGAGEMVKDAPIYVTEVSGSGNVLKRVTLPPIPPGEGDRYEDARFSGVVIPPVASIFAAVLDRGLIALGNADAQATWSTLQYHHETWTGFVWVSLASGLACGVLAWLIARRCGLSRRDRFLWMFAYALLGLPGLATLLALRSWPARVACPACGKRRIVTHEFCGQCGASFSAPQRDGTEIFEDPALAKHTEAA